MFDIARNNGSVVTCLKNDAMRKAPVGADLVLLG